MATVLWFYTQLQVDKSKGLSTVEMHDKELLASRHIDSVSELVYLIYSNVRLAKRCTNSSNFS